MIIKSDDSSTLFCFSVCNREDTYYCITAGSRQGSQDKPLSLLLLTPRLTLSSHHHRTLVCMSIFDSKKIRQKTFLSKISILPKVILIVRSSTRLASLNEGDHPPIMVLRNSALPASGWTCSACLDAGEHPPISVLRSSAPPASRQQA